MKCSGTQCVRWVRIGLDCHHAEDHQCTSLWNEGSASGSNLGFAYVDLRLTQIGSVHHLLLMEPVVGLLLLFL